MIKRIYLILIIILLVLLPSSLLRISNSSNTIKVKPISINNLLEQPFGELTINRINLKEKLYNLKSPQNTVDKHVTIIEGSSFPNILILAAHSGEGKIAYFENLDELKINDIIIINHNNKKYHYYVKEIWEEKKDGYINLNKDNKNQLILTTCSPNHNGYQLIINCIEKESNY